MLKFASTGWLIAVFAFTAQAYINPQTGEKKGPSTPKTASLREICSPSTSETDMDVNNVRARLRGGGDVWWDGNNGRYIVPKVDPASGQIEVSSIFAGSVWLGGLAPGDNLRVAAQTYRQSGNDFWPGPLIEDLGGVTEKALCDNWDRMFKVYGIDIDRHLQNWFINRDPVTNRLDDVSDIPVDVLYWPSFGNPYFEQRYGFKLPDNKTAGLADFYDQEPQNGIYDPAEGDYPKIGIRGCEDDPRYPDQMVFWIYNDEGGGAIHSQTQSPEPLRMEVQVQAFAYATNDEVNDMTFQRYKLINRGLQPLDSTFFAMWVDPDLGCYVDDYIGCDITLEGIKKDSTQKFRDLMYIYNEDAVDGQPAANCPQGVPTYGDKVPILGVDYFRGPLDLDSITYWKTVIIKNPDGSEEEVQVPEFFELGMSSFTYYNNGGVGTWPAGMTDPVNYIEYYRYMTGSWRDGNRFTFGGSGYNVLSQDFVSHALSSPPNDGNGWSMCTAGLDFGDRRTVQASGPFQLKPGAINELIIGVVWVPDEVYPCPSLDRLLFADGIAQALFDNCFQITDGPDAPNMDWIELNQELIAVLTNEPDSSFRFNNNAFEAYEDLDLRAPTTVPEEERIYRFEGYKIYQLKDANVSLSELDNAEKAQLAFQVDIRNGISKLYNWRENFLSGISEVVWLPTLMVDGADKGIRHTFKITQDLFSKTTDRKLINHRDYYYTVVAYAYNSYGEFLPSDPLEGQRTPYLEGRRNVKVYKVTPRPITDVAFNSVYGDGFSITRLDGKGVGPNYIDLAPGEYDRLFSAEFDGSITYKPGLGPIQVRVFNPFAVKDGTYRLLMDDEGLGTGRFLTPSATWHLEYEDADGNVVVSRPDFGLSRFNEQVFREYGLAVSIGQTPNPGAKIEDSNGLIRGVLEYADPNGSQWYGAMIDGEQVKFIPTDQLTRPFYFDQDPKQAFSNVAGGTWYPYVICDYEPDPNSGVTLITPAWVNSSNNTVTLNQRNALDSLNNVDIIFTSDRSKWSRCVVVETASDIYANYNNPPLPREGSPAPAQMKLRAKGSLQLLPDANGDPVYSADTIGLGWFPGYAIDVETGRRLNIFYGENSVFYPEVLQNLFPGVPDVPLIAANGRDMLWNPSAESLFGDPAAPFLNIFGGQHTIYVTRTPYDGCVGFWDRLRRTGVQGLPTNVLREVTWTSIPLLQPETSFRSWADGLIPNDLTVKLRVERSYEKKVVSRPDNQTEPWRMNFPDSTGVNAGLPAYEWVVEGREAQVVQKDGYPELLAAIDVVPNPYYGLSHYENNEFATTVKITNLPAMAEISIYTLDGKFIRRFNRNEMGISQLDRQNSAIRTTQIIPNLEWDLKNDKGIPVASGIYLIHVNVPGVGTRTLKWFGVQRQFDPSKL